MLPLRIHTKEISAFIALQTRVEGDPSDQSEGEGGPVQEYDPLKSGCLRQEIREEEDTVYRDDRQEDDLQESTVEDLRRVVSRSDQQLKSRFLDLLGASGKKCERPEKHHERDEDDGGYGTQI